MLVWSRGNGADAVKLERHAPLQFAGPSILETAWERLDRITERVLEGEDDDKLVGVGVGLSIAIAIFVNPADPDPRAIRSEAKRRYRERQAGE